MTFARCLHALVVQISLMLFTTSCSVGMMTVSKTAPQSGLVSCSVLKHCLMMVPMSCVVFLQKAAGFFV